MAEVELFYFKKRLPVRIALPSRLPVPSRFPSGFPSALHTGLPSRLPCRLPSRLPSGLSLGITLGIALRITLRRPAVGVPPSAVHFHCYAEPKVDAPRYYTYDVHFCTRANTGGGIRTIGHVVTWIRGGGTWSTYLGRLCQGHVCRATTIVCRGWVSAGGLGGVRTEVFK